LYIYQVISAQKESDLPDVIPEREASDLTDKLEDVWLKESKKSKPSLLGAIWVLVLYQSVY